MKEQVWQKLLIQPYHSITVTTHSVTADTTCLKPFTLGKRLQQPFSLCPCFPLSHFQEISVTSSPAWAICRVTLWYFQLTLPLQTKRGFLRFPVKPSSHGWISLSRIAHQVISDRFLSFHFLTSPGLLLGKQGEPWWRESTQLSFPSGNSIFWPTCCRNETCWNQPMLPQAHKHFFKSSSYHSEWQQKSCYHPHWKDKGKQEKCPDPAKT